MISDADIEKAAKAIQPNRYDCNEFSDGQLCGPDDPCHCRNKARAALEAVGYHSWMPIDDDAKAAPEILGNYIFDSPRYPG